jgi:acyl carrier protein
MTTTTTDPLDLAVARAAEWRLLTDRVKRVLVDRLELPIPHEWITDDQPLFGRGLELDSLDALELSMAIDQEFGTPVYEENTSLFGSVSAFIGYLLQKHAELPPEEAARLKVAVLEKAGLSAESVFLIETAAPAAAALPETSDEARPGPAAAE